jgi:hypothetical protein
MPAGQGKTPGWCVNRSHNIALNGQIVQTPRRANPGTRRTGRCLDCVSAPATALAADAISGAVGARSGSTSFSHRMDRYACHVCAYRPGIVPR